MSHSVKYRRLSRYDSETKVTLTTRHARLVRKNSTQGLGFSTSVLNGTLLARSNAAFEEENMLCMCSCSRRLKGGHITRYSNRTYHVLLTVLETHHS
jgi:hypothetical protein